MAIRALKSTDQERKFLDNTFDLVPVNDTKTVNSIFPLNLIATGTSNVHRIGRKILMRSVYLQFSIQRSPFDVEPDTFVRIMIVLDKQTNGAVPTWGNILDLPGSTNNTLELQSPNNLNTSKRFVTLWDKRFHLQGTYHTGRIFKKYISLNHTTQYNGANATIGNISSNSLLFCVTSNKDTLADVPALTGVLRLRFVG